MTTRATSQVQPGNAAVTDVPNTVPETGTMGQDAQYEQAGFHEESIISNDMEIDYSDDEISSMINALDAERSTVADDVTQYGPQEGNFPMGKANLPPLDRAADFRMRLQAITERKKIHSLTLALARAENDEMKGFSEPEPLSVLAEPRQSTVSVFEAERVEILRLAQAKRGEGQ